MRAERAPAQRLQVALGAAGLGVAALGVGEAARAVRVAPAAAHRFSVGGLHLTYPALNVAAGLLLALAFLGAVVLVSVAGAAWRQARAQRRLLRRLPVAGPLPGHADVWLVEAGAPLAFCAGWLRPRVFVSRAAVERLSGAELRAVLAHEHHHRARRDPLRLAAGRVLCQALFFLPVLRPLHARGDDEAELRADAAAVRAAGGPAPLAAAMLAFAAGPPGTAGIAPERVDSLLGEPPAWSPPRAALLAGVGTLAALVALTWRASAGATVSATLGLPIASSQPCVLVLALVPVVAVTAGVLLRR
jgi:Zn-dependent protease with chaperone function